mmetsp:Transcript_42176/g.104883  ORF Transcript_42176/g.104883 Transcript_42176/m.104883 type:complete len:349 (-) Transcript_42176:279-1325(-)
MNTPPTSSGRASRLSVAILEQRRRIWVLRGGVGVARVAGKILRLEQLQLPALACEHLGELHALRLRVRVEVRRRVDHKEAVLVAVGRDVEDEGVGDGLGGGEECGARDEGEEQRAHVELVHLGRLREDELDPVDVVDEPVGAVDPPHRLALRLHLRLLHAVKVAVALVLNVDAYGGAGVARGRVGVAPRHLLGGDRIGRREHVIEVKARRRDELAERQHIAAAARLDRDAFFGCADADQCHRAQFRRREAVDERYRLLVADCRIIGFLDRVLDVDGGGVDVADERVHALQVVVARRRHPVVAAVVLGCATLVRLLHHGREPRADEDANVGREERLDERLEGDTAQLHA